ncbi:MAG: MFS transporter [Candidatus Omnitrophica bacterium]|nr:MFS transporter [Candidatus Omnitrophota bacterium]
MTPLYLSAFFQNTGLTIILVGIIFYLIDHFNATLFQLGALSGIGAFVFMVGAASNRRFARRYSPKGLTLFGAALFILTSFSYPFLPTLFSVFWIYPIGSLAMGVFWPSLENWISQASESTSLKRSVGFFNLSWSPGQIIAPFLAGFLFERGRLLPIWVGILFLLPVVFLLAGFPVRPLEKETVSKIPSVKPGKFLIACWLANFAAWFSASIFRSLFPKYGLALGLSPSTIGAFLLLIGVGQVLFFIFLGRLEGWERPNFLFFWEVVAIFTVFAIAFTYHPILWAISFFLFGCFSGTAYSASLLVSLKETGPHGGGSSSHEAFIGLAICLGPIVGGGVGQLFDVRAPYVASGVVLTLILLIQRWLLRP